MADVKNPVSFATFLLRAVVTLTLIAALDTHAGEPCSHVVSYFLFPYQGSHSRSHEWRLFDPLSHVDTLFLALPDGFEGVRWDTAFKNAYFSSGDSSCRVEWRLGAGPKRIPAMPSEGDSGSSGDIAVVTSEDLESAAWYETWESRIIPFDTSSATLSKLDGPGYSSDQWFFLPTLAASSRGVAFQLSGSLAPEHDWVGVVGPLYFVDLRRRLKAKIRDTENEGIMRSLFAEECGVLLIPGASGNPRLIDSTGRELHEPPWNSEGALWVPRPRR